jgi:hypothetical protein
LQLRAGQVDVDQAALARANDGGAVDFPFLQPLRDTRRADTPRASPNSDFRTTAKGKIPSLEAQASLGQFRTLFAEKCRKTVPKLRFQFRGRAASLGRFLVCDWI